MLSGFIVIIIVAAIDFQGFGNIFDIAVKVCLLTKTVFDSEAQNYIPENIYLFSAHLPALQIKYISNMR